jgi:hypothetical protein
MIFMERYTFISRRELHPHGTVHCAVCGEALFPGEVYYDFGGTNVCTPCLLLQLRRALRPCRRQVTSVEVER